ncbi:MAG: phage holin family protein [Ancrocorticia sp.]|nr:phage holin family protein [Ancrocorticia sp.]MCI1896521.1 phage holin family protein [Ancrocorticia sp.]MCI2012863.1 phage holin family protein [Ancrocorticia sp.]MCI2029527.1 phage holin family protein [Ancrocorticia sp.]
MAHTKEYGNVEDAERTAPSKEKTIGELIAKLSEQLSSLVRDEIELTIENLKAKVTKIGSGGILAIVAAVLAVFVLTFLLLAGVAGFAQVMPWWAAFLVMAAILLVIALILLAIAGLLIKASKKHKVDPKGAIEKDVAAFKKGMGK